MEIWRDINGYERYYQVSNLGRVRSLERTTIVKQARYDKPRPTIRRGRVLKQHLDGKGYPMVILCKEGKTKTRTVHRLVAEAFIDNPLNKPAVNHIDANPLNNRLGNLEWCTILENNRHAIKLGNRADGIKPTVYKSYFDKKDRDSLIRLFEAEIGVTAIATQLGLPYDSVRYVYRVYKSRLKTL